MLVEGVNFAGLVDYTRVTITTPGGVSEAKDCVLVTPDTLLQCALPAGTGVVTQLAVTVLDQTGTLDVVGMAYARPTVSSVIPGTWSTDVTSVTVTVRGSGFGSPAQSRLVSVAAVAVGPVCAGAPGGGVTLVGTGVSVVNDTELSFVMRTPTLHVAAGWSLAVTVAGQGVAEADSVSAAAARVATRAPAAPAVALASSSNGTHYVLLLTGADYGSVVSSCANDVAVTIGGQRCDELTVLQVGPGVVYV